MSAQPNSSHTTSPAGPSRGMNVVLWVLQILLAAYMLIDHAVPKLLGLGTSVEMFEDIGLGQWFRYLTGTLELLGSIGLLIPRVAGLAALGLAGVMVGATLTNLFVINGGPWVYVTGGLFVLFCVIGWSRRAEIMRLAGRG